MNFIPASNQPPYKYVFFPPSQIVVHLIETELGRGKFVEYIFRVFAWEIERAYRILFFSFFHTLIREWKRF